MKVLDLFSGIGGFSIGLERAGFKTVAFCENDTYCKSILKKHWEGVKIYHDVREITRQQYEQDGCELPGIITGGFPCQPFSVAGRKKGTRDNRYLWPEMFRVIKEFKPRWIIAENVRGIVNIQDGVVFERVCTDLESEGYEVQPFNIPASAVGAPHKRERIWFVGYSKHNGSSTTKISGRNFEVDERPSQRQNETLQSKRASGFNNNEDVANSRRSIRGEQSSRNKESIRSGTFKKTEWSSDSDSFARSSEREKIMANTESIGSNGREIHQSKKESREKRIFRSEIGGVSSNMANTNSDRKKWNQSEDRQGSRIKQDNWWNIEPNVGRVADGVPGRSYRLRGLGNSIVPKIAEEIGRAILKVEN